MKTKKSLLKTILFLFLIQLISSNIFCQIQLETFASNTFPADFGSGCFTGVNGTVWTYKRVKNYFGPAAWFNLGGSLSARFTKKISKVSLKANGWSATIPSVFKIYINNDLKGTLSFTSPAETKSITLSSGCDTSLLTIKMVGANYYGAIDDIEITFDDLLADDNFSTLGLRAGYIDHVHTSFSDDTKTEMNISWSAPVSDMNSYVIYGTTTSYGSMSSNKSERVVMHDTLDTTWVIHHVTLAGLTPGTTYHYRCGGEGGVGGDCTFRTAPAGNQPFTYAVLSDVQEDSRFHGWFYKCAEFLKEQDVSFVIQAGDLVQQGSYLNQWSNFFESGQPVFECAPFMAAIGMNHDYLPYNKMYCQDIFRYPSYKKDPKFRNLVYAYEYSNTVHTNMYSGTQADCISQMPFMDSVYKNSTKPWKFSCWHLDPYCTGLAPESGLDGLLTTFLKVADSNNLTSVFCGHSHTYEFTHPIAKVGNPPVLSKATLNGSLALANKSQGTIFYNGAGIGGGYTINYAGFGPREYTLHGDTVGGNKTLLLATVYNDSIVYKVVFYGDCPPFNRGDVFFTYKVVNDNPGTQYALTINSGSGSGNYTAGTAVVITANAPAVGKVFDKWTGDVTGVANINAASSTITMPAAAAVVTATYKDAPPSYTLTVTSGTGNGSYAAGTVVNITANAPATGKIFDKWTGSTTGIANVNSSSTTITMPAASTAITATYKDAPPNTYTLTVTGGTGSGNYTAAAIVNITANAPATGKVFDKWTGATTGIANVNSSSTTITMPAANTAITATYKNAPPNTFTLTVSAGMGSGNYSAGTIVNISANPPGTGKVFDKWTGSVTGIANVNSASTTITMPASNTTVTATFKNIVNALPADNNIISVYPNPASDIITILLDSEKESLIKISDLTGKVLIIMKPVSADKIILPVYDLVQGIYVIEIFNGEESKFVKFIKN